MRRIFQCGKCGHSSHAECYFAARQEMLREIIEELRGMHPSIDAAQAATDLAQTYASDLEKDWSGA